MQERGRSEQMIERLCTLLVEINPRSVGLYSAMRGEVDVAPALLQWAERRGVQLALPFVYKETRSMCYRLWSSESPLVKDTAGITASIGEECVPEVVVAPCVGYSTEGWRLGNGGGYFDRWMSDHPNIRAIGLAFEELVVPATLFEPFDLPMHWIVTESRVRYF